MLFAKKVLSLRRGIVNVMLCMRDITFGKQQKKKPVLYLQRRLAVGFGVLILLALIVPYQLFIAPPKDRELWLFSFLKKMVDSFGDMPFPMITIVLVMPIILGGLWLLSLYRQYDTTPFIIEDKVLRLNNIRGKRYPIEEIDKVVFNIFYVRRSFGSYRGEMWVEKKVRGHGHFAVGFYTPGTLFKNSKKELEVYVKQLQRELRLIGIKSVLYFEV
jgi:hypothetical protein